MLEEATASLQSVSWLRHPSPYPTLVMTAYQALIRPSGEDNMGRSCILDSHPGQVDARGSADACLSSNRRRHRPTEPTTKALCQTSPYPPNIKPVPLKYRYPFPSPDRNAHMMYPPLPWTCRWQTCGGTCTGTGHGHQHGCAPAALLRQFRVTERQGPCDLSPSTTGVDASQPNKPEIPKRQRQRHWRTVPHRRRHGALRRPGLTEVLE